MNIIEIIKKRTSCRSFNQEYLKLDDKKNIQNCLNENFRGIDNEVINFRLVEKKAGDKKMKLDYGMIHGHKAYIFGKSKYTLSSRVNYGYLLENVVLKVTEMNISTCWFGYFDEDYFNEVAIEDGYEIPSIVVGYSDDKFSDPTPTIIYPGFIPYWPIYFSQDESYVIFPADKEGGLGVWIYISVLKLVMTNGDTQ